MKKLLKTISIFAFTFIMVACSALFVACGKKKNKKGNDDTDTTVSTTVDVSNYAEFKDAVVNGTCETIKLKNDIDIRTEGMTDDEFFIFKRTVTLDLNGKTISNSVEFFSETTHHYGVLEIGEGANVTIKGNGKVASKADDAYAVSVSKGGKVKIENGEFVGNITSIYVEKGIAEINGGKFSINQLDNVPDPETGLTGYGYILNFKDKNASESKFIVKGGQFVNFNPARNLAEGPDTNFLSDGYQSVRTEVDGKFIYTVTAVTE